MISADEIDRFALEGWLRLPQIIDAEELDVLRRETDALITTGRGGSESDQYLQYGQAPHDSSVRTFFRVNDVIEKFAIRSIHRLLGHPKLLSAVSRLFGGSPFVSSTESMVFKMPGAGFAHLWHQDPPDIKLFPSVMAGIYLDASDETNGALQVIPRSHLSGYHGSHAWVFAMTGGPHGTRAAHVAVPADPGDVILHATSLIHGSPWSFSTALRRTIYFHFNHFNDVRLQDKAYWTRASYLKDQARLQAAIALRADDPLSPSFKPAWIRDEELEEIVQAAT